jgi:diguanylate cyclase (GGDEF)-like protein
MPVALGWTADRALTALLEALDEGALVFDERHHCRGAGRRVAELLGTDARSLVGLTRTELVERIASASTAPDAVRALDSETLSAESTVADPIEITRPYPRTLVWTSVPISDTAGVIGRIDILRDVTRERRAEEASAHMAARLEAASTIDDLTGLVNRRRFDEDCQREHRRSQRAWAPYALVRVDVDGMDVINEAHGRDRGDALLAKVAEELKATRREYDLVARFAADEFILLLPGCDARTAKKVLRRAIAGVHEKAKELLDADVTVSTGVAIWTPPSGEVPADLVVRAGEALAIARARGTGQMEIDAGTAEWKDDPSSGA